MMYGMQPGLGKLFADPVTGLREGCDGMGPSKSLMFGMIFMFGLPLVSYLFILLKILSVPIPGMPPLFFGSIGDIPFKVHITIYSILLSVSFFLPLSIFVLKMMVSQQGRFGEIILVSNIALMWLIAFLTISLLLVRADPLVSAAVQPFVVAGFFLMVYGAFRNLCGASGTSSFWLTPVAGTMTLVLSGLYVWILGKILE